jgi:hypothetical protein
MITLPVEFKSGEGGFSSNPLIYKQIVRKNQYAVYERVDHNGKRMDYEAVKIRMIPKGTSIFNQPPSLDDKERYAATSSWGKMGFTCVTEERALQKLEEIIQKDINNSTNSVKVETIIPVGEFVINDVITQNNITYPIASLFIKTAISSGIVKFIRQERRASKGKPSNIYVKV